MRGHHVKEGDVLMAALLKIDIVNNKIQFEEIPVEKAHMTYSQLSNLIGFSFDNPNYLAFATKNTQAIVHENGYGLNMPVTAKMVDPKRNEIYSALWGSIILTKVIYECESDGSYSTYYAGLDKRDIKIEKEMLKKALFTTPNWTGLILFIKNHL